ncbi:MAG: cyanophycin synthetase [Planctomycetaceae bacterium]|nr:cyanophycin synthetase [Planctomycetaceae bacterium]
MQIRQVRALRGPNIWSRHPVLEALVDLEALRDSSSELLPGFNERLMSWLPGLIEHRCSEGVRGGFYIRLRRGTYLAHILEHVALELQTIAGTNVGYGRARETSCDGVYKVAVRYHEESLGRACLTTGTALLLAAVYDHPFDFESELKTLKELADKVCLGPSTAAIVTAATARNIPCRRLNAGSLVQLGYGSKQRRIWTAETDQTSAIAESIAQDKDLTKSMLRAAGVPVPEGRQVCGPEDAWEAARDIKGSVVVKPLDANHGRGVFMDLTERHQIETAYHQALKEGSGVIVEEFAPGSEHRLLVIGGKFVAAVRGDGAAVTGDGEHTIAQLIELQVNSDPLRGNDQGCLLNPVLLGALTIAELERQGHTLDTVLRAGQRALVRRHDSLSEDVTDLVHPSIADHAVLAVQVIGLDIAGLDLVVQDVSQPLESQGGKIVEVNAGPSLLPHLRPQVGKPRPVGEAIVETLFPGGQSGRIPIVAVTGTNGKTTTTRLVNAMLRASGKHVGMTCTDGVFVDGRTVELGDCAGPRSARNVLLNPLVDAAVFECARGGILREGLGFDKCDVAIVTNLAAADHLGQYDLHTVEAMYQVKRTPVDVVLPGGAAVLNAHDPLVARMAELSAGSVIFFALDPQLQTVVEHRKQGGKAVILRGGWVTLCDGREEDPLVSAAELPCTHGGRVHFQIENVLAATAAGWHLGLTNQTIQHALMSFQGNLVDNPARFSVLESAGKTLIVTDGRNASALTTLIETLERFPHESRVVVYSAEDDRRDADIVQQAALLGGAFDRVVLCEIDGGRERPAGQVLRLLRQGLTDAGRTQEIHEIPDWGTAVELAWRELSAGELLVIQTSTIARTVRKVNALLGLEPEESAPSHPDHSEATTSVA